MVAGAVAVLRHTRNRTTKDAAWVQGLLARKQGYDAAAIDQAVIDAMEAGKALPPKMTDDEWRPLQESHERAARDGYGEPDEDLPF